MSQNNNSSEKKKTTALVTGASAGLGDAFCRALASRCDVIIAVARRGEKLEALARELKPECEVHVVAADLCTVEGVARTLEALRQKGPVDYLVNNAGFGTFGKFAQAQIDEQQAMVNLHITATMALCRGAIPFMCERGGGFIINVSSMGAFLPGPSVAVYGATKAFLNHYSEAVQQELGGSGIRVQSLCPGYTHTEIHDTASMAQFDKSRVPGQMWMEASDVVAVSLEALAGDAVVVVPGEDNLSFARLGLSQQGDRLGPL